MDQPDSKLAAAARQLLAEKYEPIAIVGVGLRLSEGIADLEGFHRLLLAGRDNIVPIPESRWDNGRYFQSLHHPDNLICTNEGGYLDDIDKFDPAFFSISPKEARYMDPQQRIMLELCWHALEHAGLNPAELRGGDGSVYLGTSSLDYAREMLGLSEAQMVSQLGTGTANSAISGRVSYFLGWRGPCLTVDTACSSSLVAIHLASTALRNRETSIALAGGISITHDPISHIIFTRANMLAPDGRCKTFDESADGYGRSEGAGVVVLRRLSDALADGNRILGVVRGSAVRQDGESGGLTVPNGRAQEAVMREALVRSPLTPADISYVEAHGTGTPLGDPIEIHSIGSLFTDRADDDPPIHVASSKTNLGHMEAAAGIGGVLKCLAQLQHGMIYPHIHFDTPSSKIDWHELKVTVPTTPQGWDAPVRRALVNSFGFAGTIASLVLEQAPATGRDRVQPAGQGMLIATVSAKSQSALLANLKAHLAHLQAAADVDIGRYAWTASVGRQHHGYRWAAPAGDQVGLMQTLQDALADPESLLTEAEKRQAFADARVAFLLTGQGAQFAGMGAGLYRGNPAFREAMDEVAQHFDMLMDVKLLDLMFDRSDSAGAKLTQTRYTQPALFAFNYAVARMWMAYGVEPSVLLGHSVGEIAAACLAGLFSLEDAARMTVRRAELMQAVCADGAMLAVKISREALVPYLSGVDDVGFGGFNGPAQTVLSGRRASLEAIARRLDAQGITHRRLDVSHAFHSTHMVDAAEAFREFMALIEFQPLQREFVSNVSGGVAVQDEVATPEYWARHICAPVDFAGGMATIAARGPHIFLETGPSPHLTAMGRRCVAAAEHCWLATMDRTLSETASLEQAVIGLYEAGQELDWRALHAGVAGEPVELPAYVFDRESYWLPQAEGRAENGAGLHPLLGRPESSDGRTWICRSRIAPGAPGYLSDHVVMGRTIFPGTGYIETVLALQDAVFGHTGMVLEALEIHEPLLLANDCVTELSTVLSLLPDGGYRVEVRSHLNGRGRLHFSCRLSEDEAPAPANEAPADVEAESFDYIGFYGRLAERGLQYGPQFRRVRALRRNGERRVEGALHADDVASWEILNPGLLDGVLHTLAPVLDQERTLVPVGWARVRLWRKPRGVVRCVAELSSGSDRDSDEVRADLAIYADGRLALRAEGLRLREVKSRDRPASAFFHWLLWREAALDSREFRPGPALAVGCPDDLRVHLAPQLALVDGSEHALAALEGSEATEGQRTRIAWFWHAPELPPDAGTDEMMAACQAVYEPLLAFVKALEQRAPGGEILLGLVTRGAQTTGLNGDEDERVGPPLLGVQLQATLSGFSAVLNSEFSRLRAKVIDLPATGEAQEVAHALLNELYLGDGRADGQVAYRGQTRLVRRLAVAPVAEAESNFRLNVSDDGLLSGLGLSPLDRTAPGDGEIEVRVEAAGLNFKDVINALGLLKVQTSSLGLPERPLPLGFECAGIVIAAGAGSGFALGDRVMVSQLGCMQRYLTVSGRAAVRIPPGIGMQQAAAIPTAFITSYYALYKLAKIGAGDRVLIHAAAGGVGQAALQLCRRVGAEVYATASRRKWEKLRQQGVEHVMDSRSTDFADEIDRLTDGRGVTVVLNSLNKDFIPVGLRATAPGGRFVEIGKLGVWSPQQVAEIRPDIVYSQFDLSELPESELLDLNKAILDNIAGLLAAGEIAPLPVSCYSVAEAAEAFGILARGENVGKIVLNFGDAEDEDLSLSREIVANGSYLVTGGYGALGQRAAQWLVKAGARHVALLGRRLPSPDEQVRLRERLAGADSVEMLCGDVADAAEVERLFTEAERRGRPVCGIVHLAGVIADAPIAEQSWAAFRTVFLPKVAGTWNLWRAAEAHGGVSLFVGYSSIASVIGSVSQANYAAANAFIDGLMSRRCDGRRIGLALNWGPWAGAGMAADLSDQQKKAIARKGILPIPLADGVEAFGRLARLAQGQVVVGEVDWSAYKTSLPADDALYDEVEGTGDCKQAEVVDLERLQGLPVEQRKAAVLEEVLRLLKLVLQYGDSDRIPRRATFADLGVDSLVAVELRNSLEKTFGVALPSSLVFDYPSVPVLSAHLLDQLNRARAGAQPQDGSHGVADPNVEEWA